MKRIYLIYMILVTFLPPKVFSQVGFLSSNPKSTLHVQGFPENIDEMTGVIPPIISKAQLNNKNYNVLTGGYSETHTGTIVYVNDVNISVGITLKAAVINVISTGLYVFDGKQWNLLASPNIIATSFQSSTPQALLPLVNSDQVLTFSNSDRQFEYASEFITIPNSFKISETGDYVLSSFIGFNGNINLSSTNDSNKILGVLFKIQRKKSGQYTWENVRVKPHLMQGMKAAIGTTIVIPDFIYRLEQNDELRLVVQIPNQFNGITNQDITSWFGNGHINRPNGQSFTKAFMIKKI